MDGDKQGASAAGDQDLVDVERLHEENAKRLKTEGDSSSSPGDSIGREPEASTSSSSNCDASRSETSDSGIQRSRGAKTRNYRKRREEETSSSTTTTTTTESNGNMNDESSQNAEESIPDPIVITIPNADDAANVSDDTSINRSNSPSTVIPDSDTDSEEDFAVLKKIKPKHKWFVIPELSGRQIGCSAKKQSSELFQRRCYGSLLCVQKLELMYKLEKHEGCVNSLNFHPNGHLLASGSDDLKVVLWDWKNGVPLLSYDTKHRSNVFQSKFLPLSGDLHIVTSGRDGQVRLAQVSAQEGLRSLRKLGSHRGPCHKLTVVNDQPHIVMSAGEDGLVLRHDLRNPKPDKILQVKKEDCVVALYSISSHPLNGNEFCVAGRDYRVRTYDQRKCSTTTPLSTYHPFKKTSKINKGLHVTCAVYNHNGSEILGSYNDEAIYLFDVNGPPGSYLHHYEGHRNGATIKGVNFFGPKSEFIVSGSDCGNIYFWERDSEAIVQWLRADDQGVINCLEPHPQLPFLCTSGLDSDVKVWVPSREHAQRMWGLSTTVKNNLRPVHFTYNSDMDDYQILWTLWQQLSASEQIGRQFHYSMDNSNADLSSEDNSSSSSSNSSSRSEQDSDESDSDGPSGRMFYQEINF